MNLNDDQPTISADYLDQISAQPQKKFDLLKQKPIMIAGIVLIVTVIIAAIFGIISMNKPSTTKNLERLGARLVSTQDTAKKADSIIKSSKLLNINSNLNINLTNIIRDITPLLEAQNIKIDKINEKTKLEESNTKMLERLEDARLNVKYDISYAGEMNTQLGNTLILISQIYKSTKKNQIKDFCDTAYKNLEPIKKQFSEFNQ